MNRRSLLRSAAIGTAAAVPIVGTAAPALAADVSRRPPSPTAPISNGRRPSNQPNLASQLTTLPPQTTQVIIVHGTGYATTYATLETYAKFGRRWCPVSYPVTARIGQNGFSDNHKEGVPTTPTGVYAIGNTMYGIAANPGVRYPYHQLVTNDWWNENSTSPAYNTFQHTNINPGGYSEALWQETPAYTHFAVITYNMPPNVPAPIPDAGSGIFLHQFSTASGNPTAGCVSLAYIDLIRVLTWLDPAASPRIVLSPTENLSRY